jgi:glucose-1-phosphate adenylyltransferase
VHPDGILAIILAGGKGSRLEPLTRDRAKPAVPFGGCYRIIDFTLSNCVNSGIHKVMLLTQYKSMSLDRHINVAWQRYVCQARGEFVEIVPPQQRIDDQWYQGTADAVYQNIYRLEQEDPKYIVILAGDHIYKMDYGKLVAFHIEKNALATVGALPVPCPAASGQLGVMQVDRDWRIIGFEEKPHEPKPLPDDPTRCLGSMGIYVFSPRFMFEQLINDAGRQKSARDFGRNVIPSIIDTGRVFAYPFRDENRKQESYWRDVGTLDAYYEANMDLVSVDPQLNLYDQAWPIFPFHENLPPAKFVFAEDGPRARRGQALDSIVSLGAIISGGTAVRCILGPTARINSYAHVQDSILLEGVDVGRNCRIRRAIIDKWVHVPENTTVGYDLAADRARGWEVSDGGVVVIPKADSGPKRA